VAWNRPLVRIDGPIDLEAWRIKTDASFFNPDSVDLVDGQTVFQCGLFLGTETALKYFGPPPDYFNDRNQPVPIFDWWYW